MFVIIKCFKVSGSVLFLKVRDNEIVVLTNQYLLLIFNENTLNSLYQRQISTKHENKHMYDKSFAISKNLDLFITLANSSKSYLLKYEASLKSIDTIAANKKAVYCATFNHAADMLAIGGEDGKLFFYSMVDNRIVSSLKTKADYISNITFSKDDNYAAVSSFDKTITIYSFHRACVVLNIAIENVIEKSLFVNDNANLIAVTRNKKFITYDIKTGISAESDFEFDEWPTAMLDINETYTVVGTRGNSLYIINHAKGSMLSKINFDNIGITFIEVNENHLYLSFVDGEIKIIDMHSNLDRFKMDLKLNKLSEASKWIEKNIFLSIDESTKRFDEEWADALSNAKKLMVNNQESEAKEMVTPFFFDPTKREEFLFCLGNIQHFILFSKLIEEKKYIDAFKLADEYEFLKKSKDFDALEKHFHKTFHYCKLLFAKDDPLSISEAKRILAQHSVIPSKRTLVNNLILKYKIFISAEKLLKERNFKEYFKLVKQNKFLEEEEFYNRAILIGNSTFNKLNLYEQEQNYEKALQVAQYLQDFLPFQEIINKKVQSIQDLQSLLKNISSSNLISVYSMIQKNPTLESSPAFLTFHEEFLQIKAEAHVYANIGDVQGVSNVLQEYLEIDYTLHSIAQEFKIAYLSQMKINLKNNYNHINWEQTLILYDSMFGIDNELINLLDECGFNEDIPNLKSSDKFNGYEKVGFLDSVLVQNY
ncbi:MAG: hypothetical protein Q7S59_03325 [Sulfurimonas sp.]|nr:hypothetical protein [Sulfurimonas sp.]